MAVIKQIAFIILILGREADGIVPGHDARLLNQLAKRPIGIVRQARAIRRVDQRHHVPIAIKRRETVRGGSDVAAHV